MRSILKGLFYTAVTVFIIQCNFGKETETVAPDNMELSASKTAPTLSSLDTKVTTLTAVNATQDSKITSLTNGLSAATAKITTLTNSSATFTTAINQLSAANTAKDKTIKSLTDSLNAYKGALDLSLFTKTNGIITINIATLKTRLGLK